MTCAEECALCSSKPRALAPGGYTSPFLESGRLLLLHIVSPRHVLSREVCGGRLQELTLLSQLPTARKSATGQKAREDIASGGGSETSTSFSAVDETFADVELAPKKAMKDDRNGLGSRASAKATLDHVCYISNVIVLTVN